MLHRSLRRHPRRARLPVCLVAAAVLVAPLWGGAPSLAQDTAPAATPGGSPAPAVSVEHGLVSVKARDAPLGEVIERIGMALHLSVDSRVGPDERVTTEFSRLPLDEALKRLSANYAYVKDETGNAKIILFTSGRAAPASEPQGGLAAPVDQGSMEDDPSSVPDLAPSDLEQQDEESDDH